MERHDYIWDPDLAMSDAQLDAAKRLVIDRNLRSATTHIIEAVDTQGSPHPPSIERRDGYWRALEEARDLMVLKGHPDFIRTEYYKETPPFSNAQRERIPERSGYEGAGYKHILQLIEPHRSTLMTGDAIPTVQLDYTVYSDKSYGPNRYTSKVDGFTPSGHGSVAARPHNALAKGTTLLDFTSDESGFDFDAARRKLTKWESVKRCINKYVGHEETDALVARLERDVVPALIQSRASFYTYASEALYGQLDNTLKTVVEPLFQACRTRAPEQLKQRLPAVRAVVQGHVDSIIALQEYCDNLDATTKILAEEIARTKKALGVKQQCLLNEAEMAKIDAQLGHLPNVPKLGSGVEELEALTGVPASLVESSQRAEYEVQQSRKKIHELIRTIRELLQHAEVMIPKSKE